MLPSNGHHPSSPKNGDGHTAARCVALSGADSALPWSNVPVAACGGTARPVSKLPGFPEILELASDSSNRASFPPSFSLLTPPFGSFSPPFSPPALAFHPLSLNTRSHPPIKIKSSRPTLNPNLFFHDRQANLSTCTQDGLRSNIILERTPQAAQIEATTRRRRWKQ